MFTRVLRRCAPLLGAVSLAAAVFFFLEATRATPVFSYGGYQTSPPNGDSLLANVALLPTDTDVPAYPPYPPPPTDLPPYPPYPPAPTDTVVPPTDTPFVPPTDTAVVPPTSTPVVPPTDTPVVPPTSTPAVPPTDTPMVPPAATPVAPPCSGTSGTYVVQPGDNLYRIALRFGTTLGRLRSINRIWGWWLRAGQTLIIPGGCRPTPPPKPTQSERHSGDDHHNPAPTEAHWGDDQSKTPPTDDQSGSQWSDAQHRPHYTVKAGDNLFRIGLRYGVSVSALQAANGLHSIYIRVGQVLVIP